MSADKSIKRVMEIDRDMRGRRHPRALSTPVRMPSAQELLAKERAQPVRQIEAEPEMPLHEKVVLIGSILAALALLVIMTIERVTS